MKETHYLTKTEYEKFLSCLKHFFDDSGLVVSMGEEPLILYPMEKLEDITNCCKLYVYNFSLETLNTENVYNVSLKFETQSTSDDFLKHKAWLVAVDYWGLNDKNLNSVLGRHLFPRDLNFSI